MATSSHIAPSILAADFTQLGEQIKQADQAGGSLIHIDVMDGVFVPNISMGPLVVRAVRPLTALPLDVHLMIVNPERHVEAFAKAGANRITVHVEQNPNLHSTLRAIHTLGCKAGVAINPHTPASALSEIIHMLDIILVMTVNPGFGGQRFIPETMPKLEMVREMIEESGQEIDLAVDGGIDPDTAPTVVRAGANVLVAGSAIFNKNRSIQENLAMLQQSMEK